MKRIVIASIFLLFFLSACSAAQPTAVDDDLATWPRISYNARLLVVDQNLAEEFAVDSGGYLWREEEVPQAATLVNNIQTQLLIHAADASRQTKYLIAPRISLNEGEAGTIVFDIDKLLYATWGDDRLGDPWYEPYYEAVLAATVRANRLRQRPEAVELHIDMQLIPSEVFRRGNQTEYSGSAGFGYQFTAYPWPSIRGSFTAHEGSCWLIAIPRSVTRTVVTDPRQQSYHLWLLIHPVILHSPEEEKRLFPGLPSDPEGETSSFSE